MPVAEHSEIINRWFDDLFTHGKIDVVDELVVSDFATYAANNKPGTRNAQAFKAWLTWYFSTFTDREWTIHEILSEGDKAVVRYSGWVTYRGGLLDIPSADQRVQERGMMIFRIVEGKIYELWTALSDLELVMELGAVPRVEAQNEKCSE